MEFKELQSYTQLKERPNHASSLGFLLHYHALFISPLFRQRLHSWPTVFKIKYTRSKIRIRISYEHLKRIDRGPIHGSQWQYGLGLGTSAPPLVAGLAISLQPCICSSISPHTQAALLGFLCHLSTTYLRIVVAPAAGRPGAGRPLAIYSLPMWHGGGCVSVCLQPTRALWRQASLWESFPTCASWHENWMSFPSQAVIHDSRLTSPGSVFLMANPWYCLRVHA